MKKTMKTLSHLMMLLALATVLSLSGISSCKKDQQSRVSQLGTSSFAPDSGSNFQGGNHTPIPGTLLLLGSGVAGMAFFGWRRRTKR
jgi:hypothetical protein